MLLKVSTNSHKKAAGGKAIKGVENKATNAFHDYVS